MGYLIDVMNVLKVSWDNIYIPTHFQDIHHIYQIIHILTELDLDLFLQNDVLGNLLRTIQYIFQCLLLKINKYLVDLHLNTIHSIDMSDMSYNLVVQNKYLCLL